MSIPVITLTVTNIDNLPDGGPTAYSAQGGSFQIGRDAQREWTLPDPRLFVSGNHCSVQFDGQQYILTDLSRNGTFINGSQSRVKSPYRLQDGDTLALGNYVISVHIGAQASEMSGADNLVKRGVEDDEDIWGAGAPASAADRRSFAGLGQGHRSPDFVESYLDLPEARRSARSDGLKAPPTLPSPPQHKFPPVSPLSSGPSRRQEPVGFPETDGRGGDFFSAFNAGAQLSPSVWQGRNAQEAAQQIGAIMLLVTDQVSQLLKARSSAKNMAGASDRTMIGALDNNPLKFLPNAKDAMEAMFAQNRPGYLDGTRAFKQAFDDLKTHEIATYAAMQKALLRLLADLSPEAIEAKVEKSAFANRKAKAWDTFVSRWDAKTEAHENGMLDVFLLYFAEAYQQASGKKNP